MVRFRDLSCGLALTVLAGGCSLRDSEATPTSPPATKALTWIPDDISQRLEAPSRADELLRQSLTTPDVPDFSTAVSLGRTGVHEIVVGVGPDRFCLGLFDTTTLVVSLSCTVSQQPHPLWVSVLDKATGQALGVSMLPFEIDEKTLDPAAKVVSGSVCVRVVREGFPGGRRRHCYPITRWADHNLHCWRIGRKRWAPRRRVCSRRQPR